MSPTEVPIHFLNVEYFLTRIYEVFFGSPSLSVSGGEGTGLVGSTSYQNLLTMGTHLWFFITGLAILISAAAIFIIIQSTTRLFQIRALEDQMYTTLDPEVAHKQVERSRWEYIMELIGGTNENDWRQAIIEADIMLDELLTRLGCIGSSIGEKLKSANPARFMTLGNAWDAHKVRNEIAHQGIQYKLSDSLVQRTIANYAAVFREHNEI
jgi:hypothetical protein